MFVSLLSTFPMLPCVYIAPRPEDGTLSSPTSGFPNTRATRAEASAANAASSLGGGIASRVQFVATCKHGILAQGTRVIFPSSRWLRPGT
eukprot:SAG22_NODE_10893_length_511_cov_1.004854_1_plen_89_part_01